MSAAGFRSPVYMAPSSSYQVALEERPSVEWRRTSVPSLFTFGKVESAEGQEDGNDGGFNAY